MRHLQLTIATSWHDSCARGDQSAFAELVRRHGPVVLSVCARITRHQQDAEDAFQAVVLILARKASGIQKPERLRNWLFGVAVRVAQKAKRSATRRRMREVILSPVPELAFEDTASDAELAPVIDEELAALPSWYREAIVLCDLRGIARQDAATALGVPEGTLSSRLANGRKKLADRLTKRGITLSATAIPTALSQAQAAAVSNQLLVKTCALMADWFAGGAIPKPLAKLADGGMVMRNRFMLAGLVSVALIAGIVYSAQPANDRPPSNLTTPGVLAKPVIKDEQLPVAEPCDNTTPLLCKPVLTQAFDLSVCGGQDLTACWNAQGTQLAVMGGKFCPFNKGSPRGDRHKESRYT